jgi:hypothetical protein
LIFGGTTKIQSMRLARSRAPQAHLASCQVPVIPTPELRQDHDSAKKQRRQFSKHDSHFKPRVTFRFSGVLSSESTYLEKTPTAQLTRIDVG